MADHFYALHCPTGIVSKHHYTTDVEAQAAAEIMAAKLKQDVFVVEVIGVAVYEGAVAYEGIPPPV